METWRSFSGYYVLARATYNPRCGDELTDSELTLLTDGNSATEARPRAFELGEMVTCEACRRANPPTWASCLYCAANLPERLVADVKEGTDQTDADCDYEIVLASTQTERVPDGSLGETAALLNLRPNELEIAFGLGSPVPLARAASNQSGTMLVDKLSALGINVVLVKENTLNLDLPLKLEGRQ
jgi:hypothetical protein